MKIVVISQRIEDKPERREKRDTLDQNLIRFLSAVGVISVPIPNTLTAKAPGEKYFDCQLSRFLDTLKPHAVVLSGGNDIGEYPERDLTETILINYAKSNNRPLLGICRGMQMICHTEGILSKPIPGHAGTRHTISGEICKEVNSYHNYGITRCPKNYRVLAVSLDSHIEAITHHFLSWEGWMWHPEREEPFNKSDIKRAQTIFDI